MGCNSEQDCMYICDTFISFGGIKNESIDLDQLAVMNYNKVRAYPLISSDAYFNFAEFPN